MTLQKQLGPERAATLSGALGQTTRSCNTSTLQLLLQGAAMALNPLGEAAAWLVAGVVVAWIVGGGL